MKSSLFRIVGSASRKTWWLITLITIAAETVLLLCCPSLLLSSVPALVLLLPWLAVSARRLRRCGQEPLQGIVALATLPAVLFLMMAAGADTCAQAYPLPQVFALICGIVFLSYALICGLVSDRQA